MNQEQRNTVERIKERADRKIWVTFRKEGIHKYPAAATDPMLATGQSIVAVLQKLHLEQKPKEIHIAVVIAARVAACGKVVGDEQVVP